MSCKDKLLSDYNSVWVRKIQEKVMGFQGGVHENRKKSTVSSEIRAFAWVQSNFRLADPQVWARSANLALACTLVTFTNPASPPNLDFNPRILHWQSTTFPHNIHQNGLPNTHQLGIPVDAWWTRSSGEMMDFLTDSDEETNLPPPQNTRGPSKDCRRFEGDQKLYQDYFA